MRLFSVVVGLALIAGIGGFAYNKVKEGGLHGEAQSEGTLQKAEQEECKQRLASFYKAVKDYQEDHKGAMPPTPESLVPKYIKGEDLLCPTAARWIKKGAAMDQGRITVNQRNYPVTYGFRWLASSYHMSKKRQGDAVPLIVCDSHKEGMYRGAYHKRPPADAFADENRGSLVSEVRDTRMLAVRENGKVEEIPPDQEF